MSQITTGIRSILSIPFVYQCHVRLFGRHKMLQQFVQSRIRPSPGMNLLDVGCGPGTLIPHIDADVNYTGIDISAEYLRRAKEKFESPNRRFMLGTAEALPLANEEKFDTVTCVGLLHHLEDEYARALFKQCAKHLTPGGRLLTVDACYCDDQSAAARYLVSKDRGQNVREPLAYKELGLTSFKNVNVIVTHDSYRLPWSLCFLEARL
jgi:cyclopropane fatty-acyl-phospholipid synthase-like methyltransferase